MCCQEALGGSEIGADAGELGAPSPAMIGSSKPSTTGTRLQLGSHGWSSTEAFQAARGASRGGWDHKGACKNEGEKGGPRPGGRAGRQRCKAFRSKNSPTAPRQQRPAEAARRPRLAEQGCSTTAACAVQAPGTVATGALNEGGGAGVELPREPRRRALPRLRVRAHARSGLTAAGLAPAVRAHPTVQHFRLEDEKRNEIRATCGPGPTCRGRRGPAIMLKARAKCRNVPSSLLSKKNFGDVLNHMADVYGVRARPRSLPPRSGSPPPPSLSSSFLSPAARLHARLALLSGGHPPTKPSTCPSCRRG